jgi:Mrp family chromosome partitioning ATPase
MRALMQHLQEVSDLVVVNAPALTATETRPLASQADGAILVMEHGLTRRQAAQRAVGHLHEAGTHVLGAVLTEMPARDDKGVAPGMLRFAGRACKAVSGVGPRLLRRTPYPPRSGGGALGDSAPRNDG